MKVTVNIIDESIDENAVINCHKVTKDITDAKNILESLSDLLSLIKDKKHILLNLRRFTI